MALDTLRSRYRRTEAWLDARPLYSDLVHAVAAALGTAIGATVVDRSPSVVLLVAVVTFVVGLVVTGLRRLWRGRH